MLRQLVSGLGRLAKRRCYLCARDVDRFLPYRGGLKDVAPFLLEVQTIGSDVENFACPLCGCHDRERHLAMYFDRLDLWSRVKGADVLHIAPERHFSVRIAQHDPLSHVKGDLQPSSPDVRALDITELPFEGGSFDVILCNHVLEHIPDDVAALRELFRVLRPGGFAILQTPHSPLLENAFCDPGVNTAELRLRFYGQEDHVRLYGRDLFRKIGEAGFDLRSRTHAEALPEIDAARYGVNAREDLILAAKAA